MAASATLVNVDWSTLALALVTFLSTAYATYQKGVNSGTAKATATPATPTAAQAATPVPAVATPPTPVPTEPTTDTFNPALYPGGKGPNAYTWDQMRTMVKLRVPDWVKKNMLAGVEAAKDREDILKYIAEAERTNEYSYTIDYDHGYFVMQAVCSPIGINEYKYWVNSVVSGMDKQ